MEAGEYSLQNLMRFLSSQSSSTILYEEKSNLYTLWHLSQRLGKAVWQLPSYRQAVHVYAEKYNHQNVANLCGKVRAWRVRGGAKQPPRTVPCKCGQGRKTWGLLPGTLWKILKSELGAVWDEENATPVKELKVPNVLSKRGDLVFQVDPSSQFDQWPVRRVNVLSLFLE